MCCFLRRRFHWGAREARATAGEPENDPYAAEWAALERTGIPVFTAADRTKLINKRVHNVNNQLAFSTNERFNS